MIAKTFELRDRATFVPVIAIRLEPTNEADRYLLARAGYSRSASQQGTYILMAGLSGGCDKATCDPYDWVGNRTRMACHQWLEQHFDEVESGAVIDAEFILGESGKPKVSETVEEPLV